MNLSNLAPSLAALAVAFGTLAALSALPAPAADAGTLPVRLARGSSDLTDPSARLAPAAQRPRGSSDLSLTLADASEGLARHQGKARGGFVEDGDCGEVLVC